MFDPAVQALSDYDWISVEVYPSPSYLARVPVAWEKYDTTYHLLGDVPYRGMQQITYSAPDYTYKANQNMPIAATSRGANLGLLTGAAPTKGIYTGIPSGCTPNGMTGGNPYS